MINRVLIRIKVVQMLYSYLLTRSEFKIDDAPESASRDRRYAYNAYIDLLLLLVELSGYSVKNSERSVPFVVNKYLEGNKVGKALSQNDEIRSAILRGNSKVSVFDGLIDDIMHKITSSKVYSDYSKKQKHELDDDVLFWITVFETIIAKDRAIVDVLRNDPSFTNQGLELGIENLCRTLRQYNDSRQLLINAKKDLTNSLDKAYELYLGLLKLIVDITREQRERIENAKNKFIVTSDDLNPNMRLADNSLVEYLENSEEFESLLKRCKTSIFSPTSNLVKVLLDQILASDLYAEYIKQPVTDFVADVDFWREVMRTIILPSDRLAEDLEDSSLFWNDDIHIMGTFVIKTLKQIANAKGAPVAFLPKYKDDEDEKFGPDLFMYAVKNCDLYRSYIDKFVDNSHWDPERMAYMDIVIMITAIAEIINYPKIPIPVTINEFVEIANNYSTEKSGAFINGILFSVTNYLKEQGVIFK